MLKKTIAIGIAAVVLSILCAGCDSAQQPGKDVAERIRRVESEIPRFSAPDPFALLLTALNNMLNADFTRELPRASLDSLMAEYRIPGVSMVVIDDYEVEWARQYGEIHAGRGIKVGPDTYFEAGSTTKIVTAALVMKLAEMGMIDLDRDVNEYLKSWKIPESPLMGDKKVTTRLLLSHTSGLSEGNNFGAIEGRIPTVVDVLEGREPATNPPAVIETEPGTRWHYSNFGFIVLQLMLEDLWGRPYADLMQEHVFDPLGMTRSTFAHYDKKAIRDETIVPHDGEGTPHERDMNPTIKAHGDLLTTPGDLAVLTIELMKACVGEPNRLFSQETAREMLSAAWHIQPDEYYGLAGMSYGYGAFLIGEGDALCFMHPGSNNPGTSSMLIGNPATGRGAVIMTNGAQGLLFVVEMVAGISLVYGWPHKGSAEH